MGSIASRYGVGKSALVLGVMVLSGCQVLTTLDELDVYKGIPDASADAESPSDDAEIADTSPACTPTAGSSCDPVRQCGCPEDQHCQVRMGMLAAACVKPGSNAAWSSCRDPAECPAGQTCDRGSCRSQCTGDTDCEAGRCFPTADSEGEPVEANKTCWKTCDPNAADGCGQGTSCRLARTPYATTGHYCVAPFDPCPTVEDGVCDEAKGTGSCAEGTDVKDCTCAPKLPGATCDPFDQCGCGAEQACHLVRTNSSATPDARTFTAECGDTGFQKLYATCSSDRDCAAPLMCDPHVGVCTSSCQKDDDCTDGSCSIYPAASGLIVGLCKPACDRRTNKPCTGDATCATFDERAPFLAIAPGDYCFRPLQADCPTDGRCDEPSGTGLCAAGTDEKDCCKPPSPDGECNPVTQCGCADKPGTQCRHLPFSATTQCMPRGYDEPWSLCSSPGNNCPPGYECGNGACRKYCATSQDCGGAGNLCVRFNDRELNALEGVGACFMACDYAKEGPCPPALVCARTAPQVSLCVVPFNPCPSEYLSNGTCDDTRPGGSRLCALGTDPECE